MAVKKKGKKRRFFAEEEVERGEGQEREREKKGFVWVVGPGGGSERGGGGDAQSGTSLPSRCRGGKKSKNGAKGGRKHLSPLKKKRPIRKASLGGEEKKEVGFLTVTNPGDGGGRKKERCRGKRGSVKIQERKNLKAH